MRDPIESQHDVRIPIGGEIKREQRIVVVSQNDKWPSTFVIVE
jgi:hypothetical protein